MSLSGWGRFPVIDCRTARCRTVTDLSSWLKQTGTLIPRGKGRAYGDAALNEELTLSMLGLDRLQSPVE